jgi:ABC-type transport system involved in multi-copper enzyme maturation permease subunit
MVVLPVVARELRVAARGRAIYRVRFYSVLVMLGLFIWFLKASGLDQSSSQFGQSMMMTLTICAFVFCLFIGVLATADCVSSEKREGTLGLLFLTDLKGYDVICGKLAANSLNALYGLLAILPVLGLPVLLGGVTFAQFAKVALVLFSTMLLSLSVGIFVSTHSRNERKAMFFTVLLLLAATILPFLLTVVWSDNAVRSIPEQDFWRTFFISPFYGIGQTMFPTPPFPEYSFWLSILWQWLMAAALIAMASSHVPHSWEESGPKKKPRLMRRKTVFRTQARAARGRAWLEHNPFLWLALQGEEASPARVWFFVLAILAIWLIGVLKFGIGLMADVEIVPMTIYLLHIPLKIWIAAEASRRFTEDRSNNTFEALLSTPLSARQIIQGQLQALFKQFAGPIALVLAWETWMEIHRPAGHYWGSWRTDTMGYLPQIVLLVADAVALAWAGMWLGLKCKGRIRAILGSLILVLFVPWVMTQLIMSMVTPYINLWGPDDSKKWQMTAVLVPALVVDLAIWVWADSRLPQSFRQLALRR